MAKRGVTPAVNQAWKEDDHRFERYVRILEVTASFVRIVTCDAAGKRLPRARPANASLARFGRAGGYKFVKMLEAEQ